MGTLHIVVIIVAERVGLPALICGLLYSFFLDNVIFLI